MLVVRGGRDIISLTVNIFFFSYPGKKAYERMAQAIIDKYPHLGGGLCGYDARVNI